MAEYVYLNGSYVSYEQAVVPVEDRGFQFADGIYEVIQVVEGRPFALDPHLDRLEEGAEIMRIPLPLSREEFHQVARRLIADNEVKNGIVYIQLTRGAAKRLHAFPEQCEPTLVMLSRNTAPASSEKREKGLQVITAPDNRWGLCYVKTVGLVPNIMAKQKAMEAGADEAVFVRDGLVTEGSSSNLFAVKNGEVFTHPLANILPGITRAIVIDLCRQAGLTVWEKAFSLDRLREADEAFLTGTQMTMMPVVSVDGVKVGTGGPGPVFKQVYPMFRKYQQAELERA